MERTAGQYVSEEQKQRLVALVNSNPKLISGKFTSDFTKKDSQQLWIMISNELNKVQGGVKTWMKWRKCYQDMRSNAKKKAADIGRYRRQTGGGPPCEEVLSKFDESVIAHVPQGSITGHCNVPEIGLEFDFGDTEEVECLDEDVFIFSKALKKESRVELDVQHPTTSSAKISSSSIMQQSDTKRSRDFEKSPIGTTNKRRRLSSSTRLDKSLLIGRAMSEISSRDCANRERYYNQKIALLQQQGDIIKNLADSVARIAASLPKN